MCFFPMLPKNIPFGINFLFIFQIMSVLLFHSTSVLATSKIKDDADLNWQCHNKWKVSDNLA
jgi:hypothetical protein